MAGMEWTAQQKEAIEAQGGDILVSAAAGSGKTAVLVERIIRKVTREIVPVDIDRLLVVTYTKAAASEMSGRVAEAIGKKLEENPDDVRLQNQMTCLAGADMKTIHAFCLQVIREYCYLVDIDPAARTADDTEIRLLQKEVLEEVFEELYEAQDESFFLLLETYAGKMKDDDLRELILRIHSFAMGYPFPQKLLTQMTELFDLKEEDTMECLPWFAWIRKAFAEDAAYAKNRLRLAWELAQETSGFEAYAEQLARECEQMQALYDSAQESYANMRMAYVAAEFASLKPYRGKDKETAEQIKSLRNGAKACYQAMQKKYFLFSAQTQEELLRKLYPIASALSRLTLLFLERFQQAKKEKEILDFSDYEHFCLQILVKPESEIGHVVPTDAALEIRKKYEEIMIDEYQDSNPVQEMILTAISGESEGKNNRFMVGDVKQSIYRFRLAMPELFMEKYHRYRAEKGALERKIVLSQNFRSRTQVLNGVNFLFRQLMSPAFGDVAYDEEAMLYPGPEAGLPVPGGGQTELILVESGDTNEEEELPEEIAELDRRRLELLAILERIQELMQSGFQVYDRKQKAYRPLAYRDIAILFRSIRPWATVLEEVCAETGVPYYAETGGGYYEAPEVDTVLNMLRILDNPLQDIPLISLLHSPVFGFTAEELAQIRLLNREGCFYDCLQEALHTDTLEEQLKEKIRTFQTDWEQWRKQAEKCTLSELLHYLYEQTGYYDYVGMTAGGSLRRANLDLLLEKAEQYEEGSRRGLFYFIRYVEDVKLTEEDTPSAKLAGEAENLIRVMPIDKSKGLEFPVVFAADLGKAFYQKDAQNPVILHQYWGYGLDYFDLQTRARYTTLCKTAVAEAIRRENLSEELRVLYVALTRAKEKLILTGSVKQAAKALSDWAADGRRQEILLPSYLLARGKSFLDWIMPALLRHPEGKKFLETETGDGLWEDAPVCVETAEFSFSLRRKTELGRNLLFEREPLPEIPEESGSGQLQKEVAFQLNWAYPHTQATLLPAKMSISEIKRRFLQAEETVEPYHVPMFSVSRQETGRLTATQRGTALHTFLEEADFTQVWDKTALRAFAEELVQKEILTKEEADTLPFDRLRTFFSSDLAKRMQVAKEIKKEQQFSVLMEAKDIFPNGIYDNVEEKVLINGVIDCCFKEDGAWVLLDYKSDRIASEEGFRKRYAIQLQLYRRALESLTQTPVNECYIYAFSLQKEIRL